MTTTSSLHGRRIVITGASSGIGLEAARRLAREGARLVLIARGRAGLEAAARAAEAEGGTTHVVVADVTDPAQVEAGFAEAVGHLGASTSSSPLWPGWPTARSRT